MNKLAATIALLALSALAHAGCILGPWAAPDKSLHAAGNAAIVFGTDAGLKVLAPVAFKSDPYLGVLPAVAASLMREYDKTK